MIFLIAALGTARLGPAPGLRLSSDFRTFVVGYGFTTRSCPFAAVRHRDRPVIFTTPLTGGAFH